MKNTQIVKEEIKLPLFPNDIILNIDNPKVCTHTSMRISKFIKIAGYKINIQKLIIFLCISNQ